MEDELTRWLDENKTTMREIEKLLSEKEPTEEQKRVIEGYSAAVEREKSKIEETKSRMHDESNDEVAKSRAAKTAAMNRFERYIKEVLDGK